jgi:NDP-sugar pyrophosphorylase family protein
MSAPAVSDPLPPVALLAGGLATRLRPITEKIPKSLVEVAGEPFIAHQLRLLVRQGVREVVICAGYLGNQIEEFVLDGARFGCSVRYSWDGPTLLGTGGALRLALPLLPERFFVLYGDSYLPTPYRPVWRAFCDSNLPALMTVFRNEGRWDTSNVEYQDGTIRVYDKINRTPRMLHIDYGLGVLDATIVSARPAGQAWDLAELYSELVNRGLLAGYEVGDRFYEIGSTAGIQETERFLQADGNMAPGSGMHE